MKNKTAGSLKKREKPYLHLLLLVITAVIWGASYVSQKVGVGIVEPLTFNGVRMLVGGTVLLPFIPLMRKFGITEKADMKKILAGRKADTVKDLPWYDRKPQLYGSIFAGLALFSATSFQAYGIKFSNIGKAGFIISMYVVLVPIFSIFLGHKIRSVDWLAVALAVIGLYLLSIKGELHISVGDIYLILGSVSFAFHMLIQRHYSNMVDCVALSSAQFYVVGILSLIPMFVLENPGWQGILDATVPILYSGALSSGVGFTLQLIAMKKVPPNQAALITAQESTLAVFFGWLLLDEILTCRELLGCAFMFAGILISQLTPTSKTSDEQNC
ncbi:MAG TPA: DMT family transporter [Bacillota bacterium]|nr:DMT family transporter [Bacillota bacterium]